MPIISPSILSSDFSKLGDECRKIDAAGAEYVHIDVMDGVFVPNITLGPCIISSIRGVTDRVFDVHLMIDEPIRYIKSFAKAGADIITVHYEACADVPKTLSEIKAAGKKVGLSIKPKTDPMEIEPYLGYCDMVLIMTVEPGFGGQALIPETLDSVKKIKALKDSKNLDFAIEVDGGITKENIADAARAGAQIFVAGSAVFKAPDVADAIAELRKNAEI